MRIRVDDDLLRAELSAALAGAGCDARPIGRTLEVTHREARPDPLELRFFLRAWIAQHPQAALELIG
jgi:hypothetical protein